LERAALDPRGPAAPGRGARRQRARDGRPARGDGHRTDCARHSPRGFLTDRYPRRIVCLTEETTETLYLLGEGDRVVGVSGYTVRPPEARQKPKVSAFTSARFDKIEALEPDLVLAFSDLQADLTAEL